jgi:hypothetical protein
MPTLIPHGCKFFDLLHGSDCSHSLVPLISSQLRGINCLIQILRDCIGMVMTRIIKGVMDTLVHLNELKRSSYPALVIRHKLNRLKTHLIRVLSPQLLGRPFEILAIYMM